MAAQQVGERLPAGVDLLVGPDQGDRAHNGSIFLFANGVERIVLHRQCLGGVDDFNPRVGKAVLLKRGLNLGFGADDNAALLLWHDAQEAPGRLDLPPQSKAALAATIIDTAVQRLQAINGHSPRTSSQVTQ